MFPYPIAVFIDCDIQKINMMISEIYLRFDINILHYWRLVQGLNHNLRV